MLDPAELYTVDEGVADRVRERVVDGRGPVLVHVLKGFVDAGQAGGTAAAHLTTTLRTQRLVTFDADQLVDYRSRRPTMTFDATTWTAYDTPELAVDVVEDAEGVPFLLLHGVEPDVQWERWVAAVQQVVERFAVPLTVGLHGIPMGIPHTRPLTVTAHATRPDLVTSHTPWFGTVQVPASASALLELRLGQAGHDAVGYAVHVPHYLAQSPFPQASITALECVQRRTGLDLEVGGLSAAAEDTMLEIERQVRGSDEVADVVRALEEQYDAFTRNLGRSNLLGTTTELPTADELGAEFERFLAQQDDGHR
ncbi:proteasome assembly chaperone family protein [Cellulomonas marina]|uniref:PAC2 family protein n=1 Tax=Cellulomonas marina TaxID=988821 RepID=A0A1I0VKV3_9CELL|nr:PAC2 family protein [Cellulomonas marina]GIG27919.1 hypothetical protein Cma02nite_05190 [Cellulomonas marina]SFA76657.1 PAC2 family protein [Cellulomonas marina]